MHFPMTSYTHTEGIAAVLLRVDAAELQHVRINHTTAEDLHPTGVLTESATLTTTDEARDIHLSTGLCEGEVAGTQADLRVRTVGQDEAHA